MTLSHHDGKRPDSHAPQSWHFFSHHLHPNSIDLLPFVQSESMRIPRQYLISPPTIKLIGHVLNHPQDNNIVKRNIALFFLNTVVVPHICTASSPLGKASVCPLTATTSASIDVHPDPWARSCTLYSINGPFFSTFLHLTPKRETSSATVPLSPPPHKHLRNSAPPAHTCCASSLLLSLPRSRYPARCGNALMLFPSRNENPPLVRVLEPLITLHRRVGFSYPADRFYLPPTSEGPRY